VDHHDCVDAAGAHAEHRGKAVAARLPAENTVASALAIAVPKAIPLYEEAAQRRAQLVAAAAASLVAHGQRAAAAQARGRVELRGAAGEEEVAARDRAEGAPAQGLAREAEALERRLQLRERSRLTGRPVPRPRGTLARGAAVRGGAAARADEAALGAALSAHAHVWLAGSCDASVQQR